MDVCFLIFRMDPLKSFVFIRGDSATVFSHYKMIDFVFVDTFEFVYRTFFYPPKFEVV